MFSHFLRKLGAVIGWQRPAGAVVETEGWVWHLEPGAAAVLGPGGPDPDGWEKAGLAGVVKRNLQRTIARVLLPGGTVYVKRTRANTPRSFAREILRPPKARLECENARALLDRGVPTVEPLAWGVVSGLWPGESVLVTREQSGAVPFLDYLEQTFPALPAGEGRLTRRRLAEAFGRFLARLHDAGVAHPDPHPGNVLVDPGAREPRFYLMDLHAVRVGRPLAWTEAHANLTLLNRWFQMRATRTDRLRFWRAYAAARTGAPLADPGHLAKEVELATAASNNRFWAARRDRYLGDNRDSTRVRGPAARGFAVRDFPADVLAGWLADPDAVLARPGVRLLKDSRTSTVAVVPIPTAGGPREVIYKRFNLRSTWDAVKNVFRPPPALRSWLVGNGVRDRGLPTARVLAAFHRTRFGVLGTGYAVFEAVPDAVGLPEAVAGLGRYPESHRRRILACWAEDIGRMVRRMHDREVSHRDLKAPNILMAGAARDPAAATPVLIDLVGAEAGRPVPEGTRVRDLGRLAASFLDSPAVSRTDRLRCLRAYLGRGDWKSWWHRVAAATRAKATRNARLGRPLG